MILTWKLVSDGVWRWGVQGWVMEVGVGGGVCEGGWWSGVGVRCVRVGLWLLVLR